MPELELSVSATTREPREGEVDGRDYHFLDARGVRPAGRGRGLPRVRHLQRQPLRDAALRGRAAASTPAARWCSRSRSRAPARCGRRCRSRSRSSSPRPTPPSCASGSVARHRLRRGDRRPARGRRAGAGRQDEFPHRVVNDDLEPRRGELEGIVRAELGLPLDSPAE